MDGGCARLTQVAMGRKKLAVRSGRAASLALCVGRTPALARVAWQRGSRFRARQDTHCTGWGAMFFRVGYGEELAEVIVPDSYGRCEAVCASGLFPVRVRTVGFWRLASFPGLCSASTHESGTINLACSFWPFRFQICM